MSCEWPVDDGCLTPLPDDADETIVFRRAAAIEMAADVMWALSGRQFGKCPVIARPCPERTPGDLWSYRSSGAVIAFDGANWLNVGCGCVGGGCKLTGPSRVHLPGPVAEITRVTIGAEVLDPTAYTHSGNLLYRNGGVAWPGQDLGRPRGEPGTWSVEYLRGLEPPAGVARLTGLLAKEFDAACSGDGKCRLPRNVSQVSRQGITYQVYDPQAVYSAGKTGLAEIDMWLAAINPHHLMQGPVVL